jgi:hypothetical protein
MYFTLEINHFSPHQGNPAWLYSAYGKRLIRLDWTGDLACIMGGHYLSDVTGTASYGPGGVAGVVSPHAARARMAYALPE